MTAQQRQEKLGKTLWNIANCLSSADELIEAQEHKIENLKTHKKGLMQQLFPDLSRRMFPNINELAI